MKRILHKIIIILLFLLIFISIFTFFLAEWVVTNFNSITIGQIWFHIKIPVKDPTKDYSYVILTRIIRTIIVFSVIVFIYQKFKGKKLFLYLKVLNFKIKFHIPLLASFAFLTVIFSLSFIYYNLDTDNWKAFFSSDKTKLYEAEYIEPKYSNIQFSEKPNNLILIYLESIESSMQSKEEGGLFTINYIPELTQLAKENINFSSTNYVGGGLQLNFTGWTIAAMVASNTGIPLNIPIDDNDMFKYSSFLPNAKGLGDVLKYYGYNRTFMLGSSAGFAGTDVFLKNHGDFNIMDYEYFKNFKMIPPDYLVFWGVEDYKLYSFAKLEILRLFSQKQPFAFVMTTMDSHFPEGYLDPHCEKKYKTGQYENVISCTSKQAYDFVRWVQSQPFYENTTIIILGDHLSMASDFFKNIKGERHPYNCIINSKKQPEKMKNRLFSTYDWFPTIIESIGGNIKGSGLGLGRSLFSGEPTLIEKMGERNLNLELSKKSEKYDSFWYIKSKYHLNMF